jgi:hypothetical protein
LKHKNERPPAGVGVAPLSETFSLFGVWADSA